MGTVKSSYPKTAKNVYFINEIFVNWLSLSDKLSSRWSDHAGWIILTDAQFA